MRSLLMFLVAAIVCGVASAQVSINLNLNVDRQPIWGPVDYDYVEYYYLPDIEVYYNVPQRRFYYYEGGRWRGSNSLPARYRGHNLYNSYKVVINERAPYRNHQMYREKFFSFRGRHDQHPIRDSRDARYFANKDHPEHRSWARDHERGNGKGNGKEREKGRGGKHDKE